MNHVGRERHFRDGTYKPPLDALPPFFLDSKVPNLVSKTIRMAEMFLEICSSQDEHMCLRRLGQNRM